MSRPTFKTLHHFTAVYWLPRIIDSGFIDTTESNCSETKHAGPDVAWFTTDDGSDLDVIQRHVGPALRLDWETRQMVPDPDPHPAFDRTRIRITVRTRRARRWSDWLKATGFQRDSAWLRRLTAGCRWSTWWVSPTPVPTTDWVEVRDIFTDRVLWVAGQPFDEALAFAGVELEGSNIIAFAA